MHTGLFQETLRCALTKAEVASRATELAIVQKRIEDNTDEAKATADAYKEKRKRLELERRSLAREVREESTFRPVECVQRFEKGMILTIRTDTGEQINERLATETEKQDELFGKEDPELPEVADPPAADDAGEDEPEGMGAEEEADGDGRGGEDDEDGEPPPW